VKNLPVSFFAFLLLAAIGGCPTGDDRATDDADVGRDARSAERTRQAAPRDDEAAVAALEKLANELQRDGDGNVVEVNLREVEIDDADLEHLQGLPHLRSVLLNKTPIGEAGLKTLGEIETLENIDLRGCATTNEGVAHLAGLSKLRGLRLSSRQAEDTSDLSGATSYVDDGAMASIGKLTNLEVLALDNLLVTEAGLAELADLKNLEELYLAGTPIGDEALALLDQFPKLRILRIAETNVSDDGLAHLVKLPNLKQLDISRCVSVTDAGMEHVGKLTQLTRLNLWRISGLTDAGVAHLAGLREMQWLNLDNILLTDAGLVHLKDMNQLTFLHLGSTAVTDAGLQHLEHLKKLEYLNVSRSGVTAEGVAALKKKLPQTEIVLRYENE